MFGTLNGIAFDGPRELATRGGQARNPVHSEISPEKNKPISRFD